jgi:short-subunit dehydrogenase involved in D-alanine esterification of teichoic acids
VYKGFYLFLIKINDIIKIKKEKYMEKNNKYNIQKISVDYNDVILLEVSEYLDLDSVKSIYNEVKQIFPNNNILLANKNILKNITILKSSTFSPALSVQEIDWGSSLNADIL